VGALGLRSSKALSQTVTTDLLATTASPQIVQPSAAAKELSVAAPAESELSGATVVRREKLNPAIMTGPPKTKQAVLTIQSNVHTAPLMIPKKNLELKQ
jgi:hypothetical protein